MTESEPRAGEGGTGGSPECSEAGVGEDPAARPVFFTRDEGAYNLFFVVNFNIVVNIRNILQALLSLIGQGVSQA